MNSNPYSMGVAVLVPLCFVSLVGSDLAVRLAPPVWLVVVVVLGLRWRARLDSQPTEGAGHE